MLRQMSRVFQNFARRQYKELLVLDQTKIALSRYWVWYSVSWQQSLLANSAS